LRRTLRTYNLFHHGGAEEEQHSRGQIGAYDKLLATHPKIERKGAAMAYTSLNGHMVPDSMFKNTKELQKYLAISYDYIATLKPKPTKKKR